MRDRRGRVGLGCARSTSEGEGVVLCDLREREGVVSVRERRGGVGLWRRSMQRAEKAEKESREGELKPHAFWKTVYGKIFRKPFSSIYKAILRSKTNIFRLTSILQ